MAISRPQKLEILISGSSGLATVVRNGKHLAGVAAEFTGDLSFVASVAPTPNHLSWAFKRQVSSAPYMRHTKTGIVSVLAFAATL